MEMEDFMKTEEAKRLFKKLMKPHEAALDEN